MRLLLSVAVIFIMARLSCSNMQSVWCGSNSSYSLTVSETDPVGKELLRMTVEEDGSFWELQVSSPSPELTKALTAVFRFDPSVDSQPLSCKHSPATVYCDLRLSKTLDADVIFRKSGQHNLYKVQLIARCERRTTTIEMNVVLVNEFPPVFVQPVVNRWFAEKTLVKGFQVLDLYNMAMDGDVGSADGCVTYSVVNGSDMITIMQETHVTLLKTLTIEVPDSRMSLPEKELGNQTMILGQQLIEENGVAFVLRAKDGGSPSMEATMTLVLHLGTHAPLLISSSTDRFLSLLSTLSPRAKILYGIVTPLMVVALIAMVSVLYHYTKKKADTLPPPANPIVSRDEDLASSKATSTSMQVLGLSDEELESFNSDEESSLQEKSLAESELFVAVYTK